jgi:hypothetical protein
MATQTAIQPRPSSSHEVTELGVTVAVADADGVTSAGEALNIGPLLMVGVERVVAAPSVLFGPLGHGL